MHIQSNFLEIIFTNFLVKLMWHKILRVYRDIILDMHQDYTTILLGDLPLVNCHMQKCSCKLQLHFHTWQFTYMHTHVTWTGHEARVWCTTSIHVRMQYTFIAQIISCEKCVHICMYSIYIQYSDVCIFVVLYTQTYICTYCVQFVYTRYICTCVRGQVPNKYAKLYSRIHTITQFIQQVYSGLNALWKTWPENVYVHVYVCSVCECIHDCVVVLIKLAGLLPIVKWVDL